MDISQTNLALDMLRERSNLLIVNGWNLDRVAPNFLGRVAIWFQNKFMPETSKYGMVKIVKLIKNTNISNFKELSLENRQLLKNKIIHFKENNIENSKWYNFNTLCFSPRKKEISNEFKAVLASHFQGV